MKKVFLILLVLLVLQPIRVFAQDEVPIDDTPESEANDIILTPAGTTFQNGSADGQCTTSGAACTTISKAPGICVDNGAGAGVCSAAVPTIDPLFDTGCLPTDKCHIRGEKISAEVKGTEPESRTYPVNPVGLLWNYVQEWFEGEAKPDNAVYHYVRDNMVRFGYALKSAANDITNADIQKITVHDSNPKPFCTTSRLCVYNPWSERLMYQFITEETWCTDDPPGRKEGIEGTRDFASWMTRYETTPYKLLPVTLVKKISPLPCGRKLGEGEPLDMGGLNFIKRNLYSTADKISPWAVTIVEALVTEKCVTDENTGKEKCTWGVNVPTSVVLKKTSENGMAASWAGISFTVTDKDLEPFAYPMTEQAKQDLTRGGLWDTWRNAAFDVTFKSKTDAIYENHPWYIDIPGLKHQEADTLQSMNARQEQAQVFGFCSMINKDMQPSFFTGGECDKNWVASNVSATSIASTPPSPENSRISEAGSSSPIKPNDPLPASAPTIFSGATASMVPACVLRAVATIEGAFDGTTSCTPDACGAVGPFQLSIGKCTKDCHASSCPNVLPKNMTKDDICGDNWDKAADLAASVLIGKSKYFGYTLTSADPKTQREAIIIAGDSYNGTTKTISRLISSTGQPLTYGEWVYAHCDPTYTSHVEHSFPIAGAGTHF